MSDGKVVTLHPGNPLVCDNASTAAKLRELADQIERGDWGEVNTTVSVVEYDNGSLGRFTTSRGPIDHARVAGLLAFALQRVIG